ATSTSRRPSPGSNGQSTRQPDPPRADIARIVLHPSVRTIRSRTPPFSFLQFSAMCRRSRTPVWPPHCPNVLSGVHTFAIPTEQEPTVNQLANYEVDKAYVSHYQESLFNQARHRGLTLPARPGSIRRLLGASLIRLGEQIRGRHQ